MSHSGGKPHAVGDRGQRFEVSYLDVNDNVRKVCGWSETIDGANRLETAINKHPSWSAPQTLDRNQGN